jgi:hypothetical protein
MSELEKPKRNTSMKQLMVLKQYQGMSEEEVFEKWLEGKNKDHYRIQILKDKMAEDYDLTDLNANDKASLDDLCTLYIRVEDMDRKIADEMEKDEPDMYNIQNMSKTLSQWRDSISRIQVDLNITRKARKGDNETSVVAEFNSVKERAAKMLDERLSYIYCEKCNMLLSTSWFLYPDDSNSITVTCGRETNGKKCGYRTTVSSKFLKEHKNINLEDKLPV